MLLLPNLCKSGQRNEQKRERLLNYLLRREYFHLDATSLLNYLCINKEIIVILDERGISANKNELVPTNHSV